MSGDAVALVYWGGMLVLFFWVYGIASFARDLKRNILPGIRQYRRGRRRLQSEADESDGESDEETRQVL